ncbi:DDE_3 domain-containing protein [Trichonephila clavipes]|nr:DDE_3 domain-containing protein [Trichonephila clavipes]
MRGTLTGQRYADDILRPHVGPFLNGVQGAIFQQDNARPHTARVAQDFLWHFLTLPWQARSPDLSPVKQVNKVSLVQGRDYRHINRIDDTGHQATEAPTCDKLRQWFHGLELVCLFLRLMLRARSQLESKDFVVAKS